MKFYLSVTIFLFSTVLFAQPVKQAPNLPEFDFRPLNFGFLLGLNTMTYYVIHAESLPLGAERRYADVITLNPGINIGMVTNFRLNKFFSLRLLPSISFGQRDLLFINDLGVADKNPLELKSTFLECPMLIKFNGARLMNAKPYFVGGFNVRYDLAKSIKDGMRINPFDVYWEFGAGIDSYMAYFRFSTELKISVGMLNVLNPIGTGEFEDVFYTKVLDKLFSRIFVLTFYFE